MTVQLEERYKALKTRRQACLTQIATLQGIQAERKKAQQRLEADLKAAGINVENLDAEEARIKKELETNLQQQEESITNLESQIAKAREQSA